jgi:hypothetical protein
MTGRFTGHGGELIDVRGAVDLHQHAYPDLFPRLVDDLELAVAARDAGMRAVVLKCHAESSVSRAYLAHKLVPEVLVLGGIVLNSYVGGLNPSAVEATLRLGGKIVWMPTIDAAYHAERHGGTGRYDAQQGGRVSAEGISVLADDGSLAGPVQEILRLIAEHGAALATAHLSPREILALVPAARAAGVEKVLLTHPYFKVPGLDIETVEQLVRLGAMPEFCYCTVSPAWHYAVPELIVETIERVGPGNCLLASDAGQRHNPVAPEALRVFAQTLFEKGVPADDVRRMIADNPAAVLDLDAEWDGPQPVGGGGVEATNSASEGGSPASSNVPRSSSSTPSAMWRTETAR